MFNDGNSNGMVMPVSPLYGGGYGNNGFGFGGDGIWGGLLLGLLFGGLGGWGGFGGFGGGWGGMFGMDAMMLAPYFFNTQTQNDVNRGFDNVALSNQISSLQGSIDEVRTGNQLSNIQQSISNGFADAEVANCGRAMDAMQTAYNNQIANLNRSFDSQTAITQGQNAIQSQLAQCCCDNQLQTESLRATVLQENCEDRNQALLNTRDLLTAGVSNTQAVLDAVRGINDKLCDQELQAERRENAELRSRINMLDLAQSQAQQTAALVADNTAQTQYIVNRVAPYPIPAYPVSNPYGCNGYGWNNGFNNGFGFNPFGNVGFGNGSF